MAIDFYYLSFGKENKMYDNLKAEMSRRKVTGMVMASVLHITHATFYHKMKGKADWTLSQMLTIQRYLNNLGNDYLTLDYLFKKRGA